MAAGALAGIRVLDFGQYLAGPLVALMLADAGAEVIRIDPPGGPRWRHQANAVLQRGKQSLVLDLAHESDRATAQRLAGTVDVLIEGFRPGVMGRLGLGPEALTAANPRLIYCSLPGFAADDPRAGLPAWEGVVESAAGLYVPPPDVPGADPVYNPRPVASSYAAFIAAHGILAALIARERNGGLGQRVEVPLFDACFEFLGNYGNKVLNQPVPPAMPGGGPGSDPLGPLGHFRGSDGQWIDLCLVQEKHAPWFADRFLDPEWARTYFFDRQKLRTDPETRSEVRRTLEALFATRPAAEWERLINDETGVPTSLCQTTADWLRTDQHARDSQAVISLGDPEYGPTNQAGYPIRMSLTPLQAQGPRHPLDADRQAIMAQLDTARPSTSSGRTERDEAKPLAGVRVVDVTQVLAGPTAARILAEYGAEVVKINSAADEQTGMHVYTNSGKRTMLLNLKTPEGLELFRRLAERADVVHQNFTRGVAERLGIGEADMRAYNPRVIYSSVSAFGYEGFRGGWRGREELGQAITGAQLRFGGPDAPRMERYALNDYGTGHLSAFAILLALYHRLKTSEGQSVHASLAHTCTYHQIPFMVDYPGRVWDAPGGQQAKGWSPLYRLYHGADGRWFFLAAPRDEDRDRLAGVPELVNALQQPAAQLAETLERVFASAPAQAWVARITAVGVAAQTLLSWEEVMEDPLVKRRGLSVVRDHPGGIGPIRSVGPSPRLSRTPLTAARPVGPVGSDTRQVVEELGWGDRYQALLDNGAVAERQPDGMVVGGLFRVAAPAGQGR